jgi:hypothetical protein
MKLFLFAEYLLMLLICCEPRDLKATTVQCQGPKIIQICSIAGGKCMGKYTGTMCVCFQGYATYPDGNPIKCNYAKPSQEQAFFYELALPIGGGHFYSGRMSNAITKCIFFTIGIILVILIRLLSKEDEEFSVSLINISALSFIFLIIMMVWQIIDLYYFMLNYYLDGNNIYMLPWGKDPLAVGDHINIHSFPDLPSTMPG